MDAKVKVALCDVERGFAHVDVEYVDAERAKYGPMVQLGTVQRFDWVGPLSHVRQVKWFAYTERGTDNGRVGIHYSTRQSAVDALWAVFVKSLSKRQRRELGLRLADVQ